MITTCKKHGDLNDNDIIKRGKYRSGNQGFRCKKCMADTRKKHYESNKQKAYKKTRSYKLRNKDKCKEWKRNEYKKVKNDIKKKNKKRISEKIHFNKQKDNLTDSYIKELITVRTNIKYNQIPQDYVKLKRSLILLKRGIKENRNENKKY